MPDLEEAVCAACSAGRMDFYGGVEPGWRPRSRLLCEAQRLNSSKPLEGTEIDPPPRTIRVNQIPGI